MRLSKLVRGLAGVAALICAFVDCGGEPASTSAAAVPTNAPPNAAAKTESSDGSVMVRYELTGTAVTVDGTYATPADGKETMVELRATALPWRKTFTLPPQHFFVAGLVAQGPNLESSVTCKIMKNNEVIAQETGPTVGCRAEIS